MPQELKVWTIGHSTRSLAEFLGLLAANRIEALVDVRQFPGSRRYPHFNQRELSQSLAQAGVQYVSLPELGGRRKPRPDSHNIAWRNESFRGYADYMETLEFRAGIERLLAVARVKRTAIMCSEALWWRCHRALISDYIKAAGVTVEHILDSNKNETHPYTPVARVKDGKVSYTTMIE